MKFILQNGLAVYLHGTPETKLFAEHQRTLSHGCIRLENPLELANYLLRDNSPSWNKSSLNAAIADGQELPIPLHEAVPVYLWYRTAWVDKYERIQFRSDVYGWDGVVIAALQGKPPLVPKELQAAIRGRHAGLWR
jgi:murein L,D-transpeptidase YcbB/YkuD